MLLLAMPFQQHPPGDQSQEPATVPALSNRVLLLFAMTSGVSVAGIYYAQPLIASIARDFGMEPAYAGGVVTVTQVGYALGLLLLVPLADLVERRTLIVGHLLLSVLALVTVACAKSTPVLIVGLGMMGLLAVVVQMLVALAAGMSIPSNQGRAVGTVTSGVVLGIILARSVAGPLAAVSDWRAVYLLSAAFTFAMACIMFRVLPRHRIPGPPLAYMALLRSVPALFLYERLFRVRAGIALLMFAATAVLWSSLAFALSAPPLALSQSTVGLFGLAGIAGVVGASRAGFLADRGWGQWTTGAALALMLAAWWPLSRNHPPLWGVIVGVAALDLGGQAVHVTNQSLLFRALPHARNRLVAGYMIFYSVGTGLGALASTAVFAWGGWRGVCQFGAAISTTALLFWALTVERRPRMPSAASHDTA